MGGAHLVNPITAKEAEIDKLSVQIPSMPSLIPNVRSVESSARACSSFDFTLNPGPVVPDSAGLDVSCLRNADTSTIKVDAGGHFQLLGSDE